MAADRTQERAKSVGSRAELVAADREMSRKMRMRAAAAGLRAPMQVMEGNYNLMTGTCPWWDALKR